MNRFFRILIVVFIMTSLYACNRSGEGRNEVKGPKAFKREIYPAFGEILDSAEVDGAILVLDPQKGIFYSNDFDWCRHGHLPASTFKIVNSMIALEAGVIANDSTIIKWDGRPRRMKSWEQDLSLHDAFRYSCVPCYQEIARKIGAARMKAYLDKIDYGHMVVDTSNIDKFWLEGGSTIDQFEQINFLYRFYFSRLPISERTVSIMKRMMVIEEGSAGKLSGKTGWSIRNGNNNGWFVGYFEKGAYLFFIATNIDPRREFNMDLFPVIRKTISMEALRRLTP